MWISIFPASGLASSLHQLTGFSSYISTMLKLLMHLKLLCTRNETSRATGTQAGMECILIIPHCYTAKFHFSI